MTRNEFYRNIERICRSFSRNSVVWEENPQAREHVPKDSSCANSFDADGDKSAQEQILDKIIWRINHG